MGFAFNGKKYESKHSSNIETRIVELSNFKHISISENCKVSIQNATERKLSYSNRKDSSLIEPIFKIENDTLFIISTKTNVRYNRVTLSGLNITSITGKNGNIRIDNMEQDALRVVASKCNIDIQAKAKIKKYDLLLKQSSDFSCWNNSHSDEIKMNVQNSKLRMRAKHKLTSIKGVVTNNSYIELPAAKSYLLDVDENSQLRIY